MAYFPATHSTLMFGGWGYPSRGNTTIYGDSWNWRNGWRPYIPVTSPSARWGPGMAYDAVSGKIVLFGGQNSSGVVLNDTWTWNGNNWTQVFPPISPPARRFDQPGMTYNPVTKSILLFGGVDSSNNVFGDTWTWNGATQAWTRHWPASSPSPRRAPIAYDGASKTVVLFGGDVQNSNTLYNDTWAWDGVTWTQQFPATSPPPCTDASMAYDASAQLVVLFGGGFSTAIQNQSWVWNGTNWAELHPPNSPSPRYAASMTYDPRNNGLVLFGGFDPATLGDTWLLALVR